MELFDRYFTCLYLHKLLRVVLCSISWVVGIFGSIFSIFSWEIYNLATLGLLGGLGTMILANVREALLACRKTRTDKKTGKNFLNACVEKIAPPVLQAWLLLPSSSQHFNTSRHRSLSRHGPVCSSFGKVSFFVVSTTKPQRFPGIGMQFSRSLHQYHSGRFLVILTRGLFLNKSQLPVAVVLVSPVLLLLTFFPSMPKNLCSTQTVYVAKLYLSFSVACCLLVSLLILIRRAG